MNSLKISNVNNNITFESTKNLVKAITSPTKRNALLPLITTGVGVGMTGIAYQTLKSDKYDKNANKYNEKEKKSPSPLESFMSKIKELGKGAKKEENTEKDANPRKINFPTPESMERLPDFRESVDNDDYFDDMSGMDYTSIELDNFKKEAVMIKNRQLKKIAETICKNEQLDKSILYFIRDIDAGLENITDRKLLKNIKAELKKLADKDYEPDNYEDSETGMFEYFGSLNDIAKTVDVYNTMTGKYSRYKASDITGGSSFVENSKPTAYIRYFRRVAPKGIDNFIQALNTNSEKKHPLATDFESFTKTESLELFSNKPEQLDYMYEKYYLSKITDAPAKKLCREIYRTYGVRVLLSAKTDNIRKSLRVIKKELEAWKNASNGKAIFPKILDLNSCDIEYQKASAYTDAYENIHNNGAKINTYTILRHELLHMNEPTRGAGFTNDPDFAKLIRSIIPSKQIKVNGKNKTVLDWNNCKYREEFLKAGIEDEHIKYAYTNRNEFLAVAAEGDLSQYSPEFKEILIKIGMPEYVFNLPADDKSVKSNVEYVKYLLEEYPDANYDELVNYIKEGRMEAIRLRERLFNALLGKKLT